VSGWVLYPVFSPIRYSLGLSRIIRYPYASCHVSLSARAIRLKLPRDGCLPNNPYFNICAAHNYGRLSCCDYDDYDCAHLLAQPLNNTRRKSGSAYSVNFSVNLVYITKPPWDLRPVTEGGLEPPCTQCTTPSRWHVYQFHHSASSRTKGPAPYANCNIFAEVFHHIQAPIMVYDIQHTYYKKHRSRVALTNFVAPPGLEPGSKV
jgi:hypothetical protein